MITKIHILHSEAFSPNENAFLAPLIRNTSNLKKQKITLHFFTEITPGLLSCDLLCLSSKFFSSWWQKKGSEAINDFLLRARKSANRIFWFDLSDSTGTTQFAVLPSVDRYVKNQILKDKKQYQQTFYGMRPSTDFYHRTFGITDSLPDEPHLNIFPETKDLDKITVGWNSGLTYYGRWRHFLEPLCWRQLKIHRWFRPHFYPIHQERPIPCSARFGCQYPRETASEPRKQIKARLADQLSSDKLNMSQYFKEMRRSRTCLSPFGLGEISLRDFEIVLSGAVMIKQNMDHLDTWPNLWQKDKTYLDFSWDLSDLKNTIAYALEKPDELLDRAKAAQRLYKRAIDTQPGEGSFTEHFMKLISR